MDTQFRDILVTITALGGMELYMEKFLFILKLS